MLERSDKAVGRFINCWRRLLGAHSELYEPMGLEVASFGLCLNTGTSQSSGGADDSVLYVHNNDSWSPRRPRPQGCCADPEHVQISHSESTGERRVFDVSVASPYFCGLSLWAFPHRLTLVSVCKGYFSPCSKQDSCEMQDTGTNLIICDSPACQPEVETRNKPLQFEVVTIRAWQNGNNHEYFYSYWWISNFDFILFFSS